MKSSPELVESGSSGSLSVGMHSPSHHVVITGGTGSIGRAVAEAFQAPDWRVEAPGSHEFDVTDESAIRAFFQHREVDLLVCAAGIIRDAPLLKLTEAAWDETWAVNFRGARLCAEVVLPGMIAKGQGHIVFISSFSAIHPPVGQAAYAVAKAALLGLATDLAARHGPSNIRVNAVLPGFLESKMTEQVPDKRRKSIHAAHVLKRFNTCREVAAFIRFLHLELPHTSGQSFQLDSRVDFQAFPVQ